MKIKKETRVVGFDDAPFRKTDSEVLVVGTVFRAGHWMDGLLSFSVNVDGDDATDKLISVVNKTKHKDQLRAILLDGIAFGGFNVIDIKRLNQKTKLPVIVIIRNYPNFKKVERAIKNVNNYKNKLKYIKNAGEVHKAGEIYCQIAGIKLEKAIEIIKLTSTHSNIPEPLRVAHLIASGIVEGESRGRA